MEGCARQWFVFKALHSAFSGLKVNFQKSMMVPISISQEKLNHLARTFGYSTGTLPFTYFGLPLGLTKPRVRIHAHC
jgi:hypothetical protein